MEINAPIAFFFGALSFFSPCVLPLVPGYFAIFSLNKNSKYWTEDPLEKKVQDKKLLEILEKSNDIRLMSLKEYNIYIDNYIINNKYPNLVK